jgi:hypothetical protein
MSGSNEYIKDHFEIYHVIGDPSLELWRAKPLHMRMQSQIVGNSLTIMLSHVPKDTVLTIWNNDTLLKRIDPASTHIELGLPPDDINEPMKLSICFWAPGYHVRQQRLQRPTPAAGQPLQPVARAALAGHAE